MSTFFRLRWLQISSQCGIRIDVLPRIAGVAVSVAITLGAAGPSEADCFSGFSPVGGELTESNCSITLQADTSGTWSLGHWQSSLDTNFAFEVSLSRPNTNGGCDHSGVVIGAPASADGTAENGIRILAMTSFSGCFDLIGSSLNPGRLLVENAASPPMNAAQELLVDATEHSLAVPLLVGVSYDGTSVHVKVDGVLLGSFPWSFSNPSLTLLSFDDDDPALFENLRGEPDPCSVSDNGAGTITLPPDGCEYLSPTQVHTAIDGLPPGTELLISAVHRNFICNGGQPLANCTVPGGNLGGSVETFDSTLHLEISGTGALADFTRVIDVPAPVEIHTAPVVPGEPVQEFDTEIVSLVGTAVPDLDFAFLTLTAGVGENPSLSSPGHTTLTMEGGNFAVDSFFDVNYEIAFVGEPGGALDGLSGTSTGTLTMATPQEPELVPAASNWTIVAVGILLLRVHSRITTRFWRRPTWA